MIEQDLIDRLAQHRTVGAAPREELSWLAGHSVVRRLNPGDVLTAKGTVVSGLYVVLSGRLSMFVDRGAGPQKIAEWKAGDVTGVLPYSRVVSPPGDSVVQEPTEMLVLSRDDIPAMILECHELTSIFVHTMLDRTRAFTSNELHDEKMVSLGKLSAGLAHELNNPASAIERAAAVLGQRLTDSEQSARVLGAASLSDSQLAAIDAVRHACGSTQDHGVRSPIQQAEREEEISEWLADHNLDGALADELAETPVTRDGLDQLARLVDGPALSAALRWVGAGCAVRGLASEIQDAAVRITGLVSAIKGFTHMDQATVAEPVDLGQGLGNTITVLKSKARSKSASVTLDLEPSLPRALAFAGELNQIWVNLIDNALDAIPSGGRVEISARRDGKRVLVCVTDNGPGIPAAIQGRIFDPFFTTKPVGSGTGLGLDIVRRLVMHNEAQITVESQPGRTEFKVSLPQAGPDGGRSEL